MMVDLSVKQQAFLDEMTKDQDVESWGFEKLSTRDDRIKYFRPLFDLGMFSPSKAPQPIENENGGYQVPYWPALEYLERVAEDIGNNSDSESGQLMMEIIRSISKYRDESDNPINNSNIWYSFISIFSQLPLDVITIEDISLMKNWLNTQFNFGSIGAAIGKSLLPKLLESDKESDHDKAIRVVENVSELKSIGSKVVTAVDSFWLNELFKNNVDMLAQKCGLAVLSVLRDRIGNLIELKGNDLSYLHVPAIEVHDQNKYREGALLDLIVAYRDIMSAVIREEKIEGQKVQKELETLIQSKIPTLRRIGYYFIDTYFNMFAQTFWEYFSSDIFTNEIHHELFVLLRNHFSEFSNGNKGMVVEAIRNMEPKQYRTNIPEESSRLHKLDQHHWLLAIKGQGSTEADVFCEKLASELGLTMEMEHPEFLTYSESWGGPGPAEYGIDVIIDLIRRNPSELIEKLNSFEEPGTWKGPTVRAQSDALTEAVKKEPDRFINELSNLLALKRPYQYAIINGLKSLWADGIEIDWAATLSFCWNIINKDPFWEDVKADETKSYSGNPMSGWIIPVISDLLRSGVSNDNRALDPDLMPMVKQILVTLLNRSESSAEGSESDAMTEAINTKKGHCLELLFSYALRKARLEEKIEKRGHPVAWSDVVVLFENELSKCKDSNFEFSTLAGCYLPQLSYLNRVWLQTNLSHIFPISYKRNWLCAIQGMGYISAFYQEIYSLLKESGVLKKALETRIESKYARQKILQYISVAYLNNDESLDDNESLISKIFNDFNEHDLAEIIVFFWMQRDGDLDTEKKDKVIQFWVKCREIISGKEDQHKGLLSKLSRLTTFITELNEMTHPLVAQAAPYVAKDYNTSWFLEYMTKISISSPHATGDILKDSIGQWGPVFDDRELKVCLETLRDKGAIEQAREICNLKNVRHFRWIKDFYESL